MESGRLGQTGSIETAAPPRGARAASLALAVAIVLGAQALWLLVPAATLWVLGQLLDSTEGLFFAALLAVPAAIVAFAWLLVVANRRYLRLSGGAGGRGPLDAVLPPTIVLALLGATIWFVFFANHMPSGREQLIP
jgi:hypothetical protein